MNQSSRKRKHYFANSKRIRVHARDAKGNRYRLVPLPARTLEVLREFWKAHRNPVLLFPGRKKGLGGAYV